MKRAKPATWKDYFQNRNGKPPRPLLIKALTFVKNKDAALDLGAGSLNDTPLLLAEGFAEVIAVDKHDVTQLIGKELPKDTRFKYILSSFEDFDFPVDTFDLINAQFVLPFINPKSFDAVLENIYNSLKSDGIVTGQFFGDRDEWRNNPEMTFTSRTQVENLLKKYKTISLEEEERDSVTAVGEMKHWHLFHFIVQK